MSRQIHILFILFAGKSLLHQQLATTFAVVTIAECNTCIFASLKLNTVLNVREQLFMKSIMKFLSIEGINIQDVLYSIVVIIGALWNAKCTTVHNSTLVNFLRAVLKCKLHGFLVNALFDGLSFATSKDEE